MAHLKNELAFPDGIRDQLGRAVGADCTNSCGNYGGCFSQQLSWMMVTRMLHESQDDDKDRSVAHFAPSPANYIQYWSFPNQLCFVNMTL